MTNSAPEPPPAGSTGDEAAASVELERLVSLRSRRARFRCTEECVEYANLRFVEEQNRASLRDSDRPRARVGVVRRPGLRLG